MLIEFTSRVKRGFSYSSIYWQLIFLLIVCLTVANYAEAIPAGSASGGAGQENH